MLGSRHRDRLPKGSEMTKRIDWITRLWAALFLAVVAGVGAVALVSYDQYYGGGHTAPLVDSGNKFRDIGPDHFIYQPAEPGAARSFPEGSL